jgi:hypothetical protein
MVLLRLVQNEENVRNQEYTLTTKGIPRLRDASVVKNVLLSCNFVIFVVRRFCTGLSRMREEMSKMCGTCVRNVREHIAFSILLIYSVEYQIIQSP